MAQLLVREIMTPKPRVVAPTDKVSAAAKLMAQQDIGALLVGADDRLVGMLTDRDITLRVVAEGRSLDTSVADVMTPDLKYVYEDEAIDDVARNIKELKLRRFPVLDRNKRLVGIVSLGDLAQGRGTVTGQTRKLSGEALHEVSRPAQEKSGKASRRPTVPPC